MKRVLWTEGLGKTFLIHDSGTQIEACSGIDLSVSQGEFVGITGRSGSGKSTVLKMIFRSYLPGSGSIWYRAENGEALLLSSADERSVIRLRRREIGYVSQFLATVPRTSARAIVQLSARESGQGEAEAAENAERILDYFEIDRKLWDGYANTFSGGEKLRLNIARAMVKKPRLLLLDEPTASLDVHSKERVRDLLARLKQDGTTMLGIFHDLDFMRGLCDREYLMEGGRLKESA